jgi:uncharacterized membrane protein
MWEAWEILLVLIVLAFPVAAIASLAIALGARGRLRLLETRLAVLESRLGQAPSVPPPQRAPAPPAPVPEPAMAPELPAALPPKPASVPPMPPPVPAPQASEPALTFEERFGTSWTVWIGGLALVLGGFFLVRYSIEQGLLGPGVRIFLGALLAAALLAAGEWTRRTERISGFVGVPTAHIPSILTAAGTAVAYATVYAAYALYGFVDAAMAFVLLGAVALATLTAALLHGPALAALGLIGAEVTPLLVTTAQPNYWALYIYLAVVTAAAFALARARLWRQLAIAAVVFGVFWMLPGIDDARVPSLGPHAFHAVVGFVLSALLIVAGLFYGPAAERGRIDAISSGALGAYVFAAAALVLARHHDTTALVVFSALAAASVVIAWRSDAAAAAVPAAAALAVIVIVAWAVERDVARLVLPGGPTAGVIPDPTQVHIGTHLILGALFAVLFGASGFLAQGRPQHPLVALLWVLTSAIAPIAILAALYYRVAGWERSIPFAGLALLLAALFAVATETLAKRAPRPGSASAQAVYAAGAVAALALALTFALEKGWLTVALALMVPGIAWIAQQRPLPFLRTLAAVIVALVIVRIGWEPRIVGRDMGTTPIFNWLLYGYGVPALAFWTGGYLLRQRADDVPARSVEAAAILFTVLLAVLEIRHLMNNGDVFAHNTRLAELALQVSVGLAMAIGLEHLRGRSQSVVHDVGAVLIAALALAGIVFGLWIAENPLFTGEPVGGVFLNLILLGYGLPALLAIALALIARTTRPLPYRVTAAVVSVALALLYLSLEVARLYHGPVLTVGPVSDAEQYTYSAVWLAFGVVLLLVGIALSSKPARLASAAVIILTVAKVFLVDMSDLTGVWRALSFIGLGLVLVGIGYLYQRLLFPRRSVPAST